MPAGKPVKGHLTKKLIDVSLPVISTAFWESLIIHYHLKNSPKVVMDLVPGNFFLFFKLNN